MRIPAARRRPPARQKTFPAPTGGWNTRDALEAMNATDTRFPIDAVKLDNWIAAPGGITLREGYTVHNRTAPSSVSSLMEYAPPSGSNKLFASAGSSIYDVSTSAILAAVQSGLSDAYFQHTMIGTVAGSFLFIVNGADAPRYYDGSSWTTPTITGSGLTASDLVHVVNHKNRLWFIEKNTMNLWYLGSSSISGSITKFNVGPLFKKGGKLLAMGTQSRDGGAGPDDYFVAVSDRGECIIYAGTDPSSASTWALVGVYNIPVPLGRRCIYQAGSDLAILTNVGVVPLSKVITLATTGQQSTAITDKISPSFSQAANGNESSLFWQIVEDPRRNLFMVNAPTGGSTETQQFVMHSLTGGWSRFTNLNAACFERFNDDIYFGGTDGLIYKIGGGYTDQASAGAVSVTARVQLAYSDLGTPGLKRALMACAAMQAPISFTPQISVLTDYDTTDVPLSLATFVDEGEEWDVAEWDVADWGYSIGANSRWHSVSGVGNVLSPAFAVQSDVKLILNAIDVTIEAGAPF